MKELIFQTQFFEIAALLTLAAAVGFVGNLLRQPLIVSFIAAGIIAGPSVLDIARSGFDAVVIGAGAMKRRLQSGRGPRPASASGSAIYGTAWIRSSSPGFPWATFNGSYRPFLIMTLE